MSTALQLRFCIVVLELLAYLARQQAYANRALISPYSDLSIPTPASLQNCAALVSHLKILVKNEYTEQGR